MDVAVFGDVGTVAHEVSAFRIDSTRHSFGGGVRFHNATSTLFRVDVGHSADGYRVFFVMSEPFKRQLPSSGRASVVPFVP